MIGRDVHPPLHQVPVSFSLKTKARWGTGSGLMEEVMGPVRGMLWWMGYPVNIAAISLIFAGTCFLLLDMAPL